MAFSDATASLLGYVYQVRYALLQSLIRLRSDPTFRVYLEKLDDVVFESPTKGQTLLQLKHHRRRQADLSDASPDLWKTLRVWCEAIASGEIDSSTTLGLVTTADVAPGSVCSLLDEPAQNRDLQAIHDRLLSVAMARGNQALERSFTAYLALLPDQRLELVRQIELCPRSEDIDEIQARLHDALRLSARPNHVERLSRDLEGWWVRRVIGHLSEATEQRTPILGSEIQDILSSMREQLHPDSLPMDDLPELTAEHAASYSQHNFVLQLELIRAKQNRRFSAISDYYQAREQRGRWVRESLLFPAELTKYDAGLTAQWRRKFDAASDELADDAPEEMRVAAGRQVLSWAEGHDAPLRPNVRVHFLTIGSLHMLADRLDIGWHPDYDTRVKPLANGRKP